jgi:hypothetical protein
LARDWLDALGVQPNASDGSRFTTLIRDADEPLAEPLFDQVAQLVVFVVVLVHAHSVAGLGVEKPLAFPITIFEGHLYELEIHSDLLDLEIDVAT